MATLSSAAVPGQCTNDATFRTMLQFMHDTFALGWVQTSDTGQINLTTVTRPVGSNTVAGYEVWRMNDTLQATKPCYLKIEYGTNSGSVSGLQIWLTIGTGSDGAGAITGQMLARTSGSSFANVVGNQQCFGSAASNRITWALMLTAASSSSTCWLSIERTKDSSGVDTSAGLIVGWSGGTSHKYVVLPFGAVAPTPENGLHFILSSNNPTAFSADQGLGLVIPLLGVAIQPGLNLLITNSNDFAAYAQVTFTLYGASHTWQHCGGGIASLRSTGSGTTDANTRMFILYE